MLNKFNFTCDYKNTAVQFSELNHLRASVHFIDGLDLLSSAEGRNIYDGNNMVELKQFYRKIYILWVSTSFRPFSLARSRRQKDSSADHEGVRLLDVNIHVAIGAEPLAIIFEQAFRFALSESVSDLASPVVNFLAECDIELAMYVRAVFVVDGKIMLVVARPGIYIVFRHENVGGALTLEALKHPVKDATESISITRNGYG